MSVLLTNLYFDWNFVPFELNKFYVNMTPFVRWNLSYTSSNWANNFFVRLNDGSLQGFEWFRLNYLFVGTTKLYDSIKCDFTSNIMYHSYLNLNMSLVSLPIFFLTNIYLLQVCMIPLNDIIHTCKQK